MEGDAGLAESGAEVRDERETRGRVIDLVGLHEHLEEHQQVGRGLVLGAQRVDTVVAVRVIELDVLFVLQLAGPYFLRARLVRGQFSDVDDADLLEFLETLFKFAH